MFGKDYLSKLKKPFSEVTSGNTFFISSNLIIKFELNSQNLARNRYFIVNFIL